MLRIKKTGAVLLLIIFILTMVTGCTKVNQDKNFKSRVQLTNEYMDILSTYNGVSRVFSETVKPFEDQKKREEAVYDGKFWRDFDKDKAKTLEKMGKLKHYDYKFDAFKVLTPDFVSYVEKMEHYFKVIEEKRQAVKEWNDEEKKELNAELSPLYKEIFDQSTEIVHKLDVVYNQVFVVEEEKKENN